MKRMLLAMVLAVTAVGGLGVCDGRAQAFDVNLSMNVFPSDLGMPNAGGTWTIVAKTNSPLGIAAISAYAVNVNVAGITIEMDLGSILNNGQPFVGVVDGAVNMVYGQDTTTAIVPGVGTPSMSDGPDPLGNSFWNGATKIFSGTYSGSVPAFAMAGTNVTDANVLSTTTPGPTAAGLDANTTTVVRVAVPEPTTAAICATALAGLIAVRRRR